MLSCGVPCGRRPGPGTSRARPVADRTLAPARPAPPLRTGQVDCNHLQPQLPHETKIWSSRSPTRSAIAQTARRPSVDITDTTPAHTAAASRPDRHHTHGHQVAIVGWHLYEPYGTVALLLHAPQGPQLTDRPQHSIAARPTCSSVRLLNGVAWAWPGRAVDATKE